MRLTQEILKEALDYSPNTGIFIWRNRSRDHFSTNRSWMSWNKKFANKIAGSVKLHHNNISYCNIKISGKIYQAHRLAWFYCYSEWPQKQIDHIDGNGLNNRIDNLRDVSNQENTKNSKRRVSNTSGVTGVYWCKKIDRWYAHISANGKQMHLGSFGSIFDAACARRSAEHKFGYHSNHGREVAA